MVVVDEQLLLGDALALNNKGLSRLGLIGCIQTHTQQQQSSLTLALEFVVYIFFVVLFLS